MLVYRACSGRRVPRANPFDRSGFEVTGTVRNLADGRVYLAAEGEQREVLSFFGELSSEMEHYIKNSAVQKVTGTRSYSGFSIS